MNPESPDVCLWCEEPVSSSDGETLFIGLDGPPVMRRRHAECEARSVVGSVGHQEGRCSCYGGTEEDPPGMTPRQSARAALALFRKNGPRHSPRVGAGPQ